MNHNEMMLQLHSRHRPMTDNRKCCSASQICNKSLIADYPQSFSCRSRDNIELVEMYSAHQRAFYSDSDASIVRDLNIITVLYLLLIVMFCLVFLVVKIPRVKSSNKLQIKKKSKAGVAKRLTHRVYSSYAFPFGRYCAFTAGALIDLVTMTFDLLTSK